jgi:hypothetical protein
LTVVGDQPAPVAALAGRRIDASSASQPHFPLEAVPKVRRDISEMFSREHIGLLVCSAACGADLIALETASAAGIECRVVLPFERCRFRAASVIDRPGDWGQIFDRVIALAEGSGNLRVLPGSKDDNSSYLKANEFIIKEAITEARGRPALAIIVWEGKPRDHNDATDSFRRLAVAAGMEPRTVLTVDE